MKFGLPPFLLALVVCAGVRAETALPDQIVLLDVQGLWGGVALWLSQDGRGLVQSVSPPEEGQAGLQEVRYAVRLSREEAATLTNLVNQADFFNLQTAVRPGLPDEARPVIFIQMGGQRRAVAKWAHDEQRGFDRLYSFLRELAAGGKKGVAIKRGAYDWPWRPEGFPEPQAILGLLPPVRAKE